MNCQLAVYSGFTLTTGLKKKSQKRRKKKVIKSGIKCQKKMYSDFNNE